VKSSPSDIDIGKERLVTVDLLLQVTRGEDNRLSGSVHRTDDASVRTFSGTLELMRVFEELVPVVAAPGSSASQPDAVRVPRTH
jgi:hypothetical protein